MNLDIKFNLLDIFLTAAWRVRRKNIKNRRKLSKMKVVIFWPFLALIVMRCTHTHICETLHWIMEVTFVELSQGISCQKGQKIR